MKDLKQFREDKMAQAEIERFDTVKIKDREEAETLFGEIQHQRAKLMNELRDNDSNDERQIIHDVLYELKTVRNKIGSQLNAIGRANINRRKMNG